MSAARRATIKNVTENGWERAAAINFNGWGDCRTLNSSSSNMIVIRIDSATPAQGRSEHCTNASTCNGGFGKAASGDFNRIRFIDDATAARPATVLHEFGHALGFYHESNDDLENGEANPFCEQRTRGGTSLENEGDVERSVMTAYVHACNPNMERLSSWDILGARAAYGMKAPGTLSGVNGIVLNIQGGSTDVGTKNRGLGWQRRLEQRLSPTFGQLTLADGHLWLHRARAERQERSGVEQQPDTTH